MRLISGNVKVTLEDARAEECLEAGLELDPDVFGLQEWGRSRADILRRHGVVIAAPRLRRLFRRPPSEGYVWVYPTGGQPVGLNAKRFEVLSVRQLIIADERPGVRETEATEVSFRPRGGGSTRIVLNTHTVAHLNRRPNLLASREAFASIDEWSRSLAGHRRYVMGDLNKEAVQINGLVSCRVGNGDLPTFRGRGIDHIFGPKRFARARVVRTPSDHDLLVADED